ncbi:MAG TPA: hypothetical protein VMT96_00765 [Candidatus Bathyarchaeia archaeon]|nr:hypothetical protein [Candidatus Bathyarchaeia archaeon]
MATQLITPNPNITCTPGLCLVYVRETFGIGPKYPTATAGWDASDYRHRDQDFPVGVWVPLWFYIKGNPDGHVALRQPDGSIWSASSPYSSMPVHHPSLDNLESYYGGRLSYLGWTEDVEGVMVVDNAYSPPQSNVVYNSSVTPIPQVEAVPFRIENGKQILHHKRTTFAENEASIPGAGDIVIVAPPKPRMQDKAVDSLLHNSNAD